MSFGGTMEFLKMDKTVNMTDLSFAELCKAKYGVNRGIYNTIDSWFFEKGLENILLRREMILNFLEFLCSRFEIKVKNDGIKLKTGNGGLTHSLERYWNANKSEHRVSSNP
jgi:riboflavin kinase